MFPTGGHNHNYLYSAVDGVNHTVTCSECDYSATEAHTFDADNKCTKCGYQKQTQKTLTLTGTYDASTKEIVFTIPEGTAADTIITLDFSGEAMDYINKTAVQPGSCRRFRVKIIDNSGNAFKISGAYFANDTLKQYLQPDGTYLLPDAYAPVITHSTDFLDYMKNIFGYTSVGTEQIAAYRTAYRTGDLTKDGVDRTFTKYLKDKYNVTSLSDLPFLALYALDKNSGSISAWQDRDNSSKNGLVNGVTGDDLITHVEPEIIKVLTDGLYDDSVIYSFAPQYSAFDKYVNGIGSSDWELYKSYVSATWKTDCTANGWDVHSLIELMNGERIPEGLNFTQTTDNGVTTTSGAILCWWHGYIAGNAYQATTILGLTSMQITMTTK